MRPEAQRIAIAQWCGGWKPYSDGKPRFALLNGKQAPVLLRQSTGVYEFVPDYLNDLDAMREAEKRLSERQQVWYLQKLSQIRLREEHGGTLACIIDRTIFATAEERAEALLRTIGKWEEKP